MRYFLISLLFCSSAIAAPIPKDAPLDPLGRPTMGIHAGPTPIGELGILIGDPYNTIKNSPICIGGGEVGDMIVKIGDEKIYGFDHMVQMIGMYRPGAVVKVEVTRNGNPVTFYVKTIQKITEPVAEVEIIPPPIEIEP